MPVTMDGMASGMNTNAIIDKLMEVEARPIQKLQEEKKKGELRKDALKVLSKHLTDLDGKANDLFGFRASYNEKSVASSNKSVIEADVTKSADNGVTKIEVLEIASVHKIASDPVAEKDELPAGKFNITVGSETHSVKFGGGTLQALKDRIDESAPDLVSTSYIKTSENNYIITLESKVTGKRGEIHISGDEELLKKAGIATGKQKDGEKVRTDLVFDGRYFTSYMGEKKPENQNGSMEVRKDGKSVRMKGLLWQEYLLPVPAKIGDDTMMEFDFTYVKPKDEEEDNLPYKVEMGPEEKINVKGIVLKGYNISRIRPLKKRDMKKFDTILGVGVVTEEGGKRTEKIYPVDKDSKVKQEIPIGRDFKGKQVGKIVFYCNDGEGTFSNAVIYTPVKTKEELMEPKNVIAKASNAKFKVNGITVERDKNTDINDVIKGVNLQLKGPSTEAVTLKVDPDIDKSVKKIKDFVDAYNAYLDLSKDLIKAEKVDKPIRDGDKKPLRGMFVGDMTIIRLDTTLKRIVGSAYPSRAARPVKMLAEIGVTTGKINASWETIKEGKLVIDEPLLREMIRDNPEGVTMFFGSDTDGDRKTDAGMGYELSRSLKPYVSFGKNIIATKIELEDDTIKMANTRIEKHEAHLKSYQAKLKQKFSQMERSISGAKNQRNWMNNSMGGGAGGPESTGRMR